MMILQLALLTCFFYLLIAALLELTLTVVAHVNDGVIVGGKLITWGSAFAVVWLISFSTAFYIIHSSIMAKLPR
jgi:hypothetical protein